MKNKIIPMLFLFLSLGLFASCNKNQHESASIWSYDENFHWHVCMTPGHHDVIGKEEHHFDEGITIEEYKEFITIYTCEDCKYEKRIGGESGDHVHTFDMERYDYNGQKHWHPATCGHNVLRKDEAEHIFLEEVTIAPDYGKEGEKRIFCTVCDYDYKEKMSVLSPKENTLQLKENVKLEKTYDGKPFVILEKQVIKEREGEVIIRYKEKNASVFAYSSVAPFHAGEYQVEISMDATREWQATFQTYDFVIHKKELVLPTLTCFERSKEEYASGIYRFQEKDGVMNQEEIWLVSKEQDLSQEGTYTLLGKDCTLNSEDYFVSNLEDTSTYTLQVI